MTARIVSGSPYCVIEGFLLVNSYEGGALLPSQLLALAFRQHGALSRTQILGHLNKRQLEHLVAKGSLVRIAPETYAFDQVQRSWFFAAFVAMLSIPGAALSERSAARFWQIPGIVSERISINVDRALRKPKREGLRIRSVVVHEAHVVEMDGLRVTNVERTLVDLIDRVSFETLSFAVQFCLQKKMVTIHSLRAVIAEMPIQGRRLGPIRNVIDQQTDADLACESFLEKRILHWIIASGLPVPEVQSAVITKDRSFRPDLRYSKAKIIIEVDGPHHLEPIVAAYDRRRRNILTNEGHHFLIFGLEATKDEVVEAVSGALAQARIRAA